MFRNDIRDRRPSVRIILVYKLPLQTVMLGFGFGHGLGLKANILALALKLKSLALALQPEALALPPKALGEALGEVLALGEALALPPKASPKALALLCLALALHVVTLLTLLDNVFVGFCAWVCVSVCKIFQNVINGF